MTISIFKSIDNLEYCLQSILKFFSPTVVDDFGATFSAVSSKGQDHMGASRPLL